ncbi:response regulator [Loktanella sp. M215]|uniref:response regulator n=1 Tax=Loktanella sp. M215 TaxID=2675431 RepID=UPI001F00BE45|nr:response regulator [Loktanella sp. M215]MCF7701744.1 response regulator [Loktanella sp. M215]
MPISTLPAVLVVEDEPLIRMDAIDIITEPGFRTYEAKSADETIALMNQHTDIGILFTDVEMPGSMDGLKLAAYIRDRWPPVVIIIASGATHIDAIDIPVGSLFFQKPYPSRMISQALQDIAAAMSNAQHAEQAGDVTLKLV